MTIIVWNCWKVLVKRLEMRVCFEILGKHVAYKVSIVDMGEGAMPEIMEETRCGSRMQAILKE